MDSKILTVKEFWKLEVDFDYFSNKGLILSFENPIGAKCDRFKYTTTSKTCKGSQILAKPNTPLTSVYTMFCESNEQTTNPVPNLLNLTNFRAV